MYERFFNLSEPPFTIAPNPHYLYMSQQHNEALAHLIYGVGRDGGFVLLTGEVGTGKTTVCRCFLEQVPEGTDVAFILNPKLEVEELLATLCDELSIPYIDDSVSIKNYVDCISNFLIEQHGEGRHTVLIIDEAQNLRSDVLEQIRLLTNLETHEKKLLQIVLLGQPELQMMFQQPELRQLSQRVTARFHLTALRPEEVAPYVYHRLAIAGAIDPRSIFSEPVLQRLHQISGGIPRIINLICDRAMLGAYARETRVVDMATLTGAANEVLGQRFSSPSETLNQSWMPFAVGAAIAGVVALCLGALWFVFVRPATLPAETVSSANIEAEAVTPAMQGSLIEAPSPVQPPPPLAVMAPVQPMAEAVEMVEPEPEPEPEQLGFSDAFALSSNMNEADAYADLFDAWGEQYNAQTDGSACQYAEGLGLSCLNRMGSLGSIRHYGLPVMLKLFDDRGEQRFVVMRGLSDKSASLYLGGQTQTVSLENLDQYWRGHYYLLWKKPSTYHGPMHPGTIAPLSKWVALQLDILEQKPEPALGRSSYEGELVERVKEFQRRVGEIDDGVVGTGTLIQLSRRIDQSVPLLSSVEEGS